MLFLPCIGKDILIGVEDEDLVKVQIPRLKEPQDLQPLEGCADKWRAAIHDVFPEEDKIAGSLSEGDAFHERPRKNIKGCYEGLGERMKEGVKPRGASIEDIDENVHAFSGEVPDVFKGKKFPYRIFVNDLEMFSQGSSR